MAKEKHDYFSSFAQQVELAVKEAELLLDVVENFTTAEAVQEVLPKAHEIESQADEVAHSNYNAIAIDFITPIDRDDIISLTHAIDNIVDEIEDVIQSFYMTDVRFMHTDAVEMARYIKQGCEALQRAMGPFSDFKKSDVFREAILQVSDCEEAADNVYMEMVHRLYVQEADNPVRLLVWTRISALMERCCDAFEHAADLMSSIYLKNA